MRDLNEKIIKTLKQENDLKIDFISKNCAKGNHTIKHIGYCGEIKICSSCGKIIKL